MPSDGQHVYGAQHPPSIKLIKELKGSAAANVTSELSEKPPASSFKDYENKTNDAWDIEEDVNWYSQLNEPHLISITDSEKMAKMVIQKHQATQEKLNTSTSSPSKKIINSANLTPRPIGNGPGKALRQNNPSTTQELNQTPKLVSNFKNISISSKDFTAQNQSAQPASSILNSKNQMKAQPAPSSLRSDQTSRATTPQMQYNNYSHYLMNINQAEETAKIEKFKRIISNNPINLEELQKACWKGIPKVWRATCWKVLSDYLPLKQELQEKTIDQKRNSYWESVNEHYSSIYIDTHHETLRQILNDIPRMNPLIPIFQKKIVQDIFQRVLYVWAVRHPASGYVQGINDLLTPFFAVFLSEYTDINTEIEDVDIENMPEKQLRQVEADSYWCMNKLLERIQENYVFSQPGIQRKVQSLEDLVKRIDKNLHEHLRTNNIEFIQFAFRWMNNLLMREIPLTCTIRLWDTYHAEPFGFSDFHLYVCAAFILRYSKSLTAEKDFQGLMLLLQNLPTRNLKAADITLLTAEAYKLQVMFANSPNHTA